jgi:hypothetical protein
LVIKIRGSGGSTGKGGEVGVVHRVGKREACGVLMEPPHSQQNSDWEGGWNCSLSHPDKGFSKTRFAKKMTNPVYESTVRILLTVIF